MEALNLCLQERIKEPMFAPIHEGKATTQSLQSFLDQIDEEFEDYDFRKGLDDIKFRSGMRGFRGPGSFGPYI